VTAFLRQISRDGLLVVIKGPWENQDQSREKYSNQVMAIETLSTNTVKKNQERDGQENRPKVVEGCSRCRSKSC